MDKSEKFIEPVNKHVNRSCGSSIMQKVERYRRFFCDDSPGQILATISP